MRAMDGRALPGLAEKRFMPEQAPVGIAEINGEIKMCACRAGRSHGFVLPYTGSLRRRLLIR